MRYPSNIDMIIIRHAVENASNEAITDEGIVDILAGRDGLPSHVRAVFGDASLSAISGAASAHGIRMPIVLDAYRAAKQKHAAANPELDAALEEAVAWGAS